MSHIAPSLCKGNIPKQVNVTVATKKKTDFQGTFMIFADLLFEISELIIVILTAQIMDLQKGGQLSPPFFFLK